MQERVEGLCRFYFLNVPLTIVLGFLTLWRMWNDGTTNCATPVFCLTVIYVPMIFMQAAFSAAAANCTKNGNAMYLLCFSVFSLFNFPFGTALGIYTMILLWRDEGRNYLAETRMKRTAKIKNAILEALLERGSDKTICPSEVARKLDDENWRDLMPEVRQAADELKDEKRLEVLQKNKRIESAVNAEGPIRLRLLD